VRVIFGQPELGIRAVVGMEGHLVLVSGDLNCLVLVSFHLIEK
jgi:hypothetical protein